MAQKESIFDVICVFLSLTSCLEVEMQMADIPYEYVQVLTLNPEKGLVYFKAWVNYVIYDVYIYMCLCILILYIIYIINNWNKRSYKIRGKYGNS